MKHIDKYLPLYMLAILFAVIFGFAGYTIHATSVQERACTAQGGVLLATFNGYACVQVHRIELK